MPLSRLLLAACALPLMLHAQSADPAKPFSYADTVALVKERAKIAPAQQRYVQDKNGVAQPVDNANSRQLVYVTSPPFTYEIYFTDGKEVTRKMPYCRMLDLEYCRTLEGLIPTVLQGETWQAQSVRSKPTFKEFKVLVYRAGQNDPAFKLEGRYEEIKNSQFPLKNGDLVVVSFIL